MEVLQMFRHKQRNELLSCPLTRRGCCGERFLPLGNNRFTEA